MSEDMDISPNYSTADWNALNLSDPTQYRDSWEQAIEIFEDRIRGRFLNIVDRIQLLPYSGFVVMAIDCLLIETLEQFYRGVPESVGGSKQFFTAFFDRSGTLSQGFDKKQRRVLYEHFRCGILHQAEIKGSSLVWKVGPLVRDTKENNSDNGIIVNRQIFHEILVCEFNSYAQKLRTQDAIGVDLRLKFRTKMDYICRKPQYYFAFRNDITDQIMRKELGQIENTGPATLQGWKVKKNKNGDCIGVISDNNCQIPGNVYLLLVEQLDNLQKAIEKDNKPIPVLLNCSVMPQYQMAWVYSR